MAAYLGVRDIGCGGPPPKRPISHTPTNFGSSPSELQLIPCSFSCAYDPALRTARRANNLCINSIQREAGRRVNCTPRPVRAAPGYSDALVSALGVPAVSAFSFSGSSRYPTAECGVTLVITSSRFFPSLLL